MTMCQYYDKNIPIKQSKKYIKLLLPQMSGALPLPLHPPLSLGPFELPYQLYHYNNMDQTVHFELKQTASQVEMEGNSSGAQEQVDQSSGLLPSKGLSRLLRPLQVMDDVTLLRRQLKYFSKTILKLSRRIYQQQENIRNIEQQLQECQHMYQKQCSQKEAIASELANLKASQTVAEKKVTLREKMLAEEPTEADSTRLDIMDRYQLLEGQNRQLLVKLRENQKSRALQRQSLALKDYEIDEQRIKLQELRDSLQKQRARVKDQNIEISTLKAKFHQASEDLSEAKAQNGLLKLENKEMERQLAQYKHSHKRLSQIELLKLTSKESSPEKTRKILQQSKSFSYSELAQKYRKLVNHYQTLKNEATYLKYRIQCMTSDERDAEHMVIDRFIQVLNIYSDKLREGEAPVKVNLQKKKQAFMRRLAKEYQKFIQTVPLN